MRINDRMIQVLLYGIESKLATMLWYQYNNWKLAFRNILRNPRRTTISLLSIIASSTAIIVFGGFIAYTFEGLKESTIYSELGHLQIAKKGYFNKGAGVSSEFLIENAASIDESIRKSPLVDSVSWRLSGSGLISAGENSFSAHILGIMPEREQSFTAFEILLAGKQLDKTTPDGCLIGQGLAKGLNVADALAETDTSTVTPPSVDYFKYYD